MEGSKPTISPQPTVAVMVRYADRSSYLIVERDVPLTMAANMVQELRSDPDVAWAYCTEPEELP